MDNSNLQEKNNLNNQNNSLGIGSNSTLLYTGTINSLFNINTNEHGLNNPNDSSNISKLSNSSNSSNSKNTKSLGSRKKSKLNKSVKSTNKNNFIKNLFIRVKENFINEEIKNEIIYPIYNEIYFRILPHYLTFLILHIIIIILLISLIYLIINIKYFL